MFKLDPLYDSCKLSTAVPMARPGLAKRSKRWVSGGMIASCLALTLTVCEDDGDGLSDDFPWETTETGTLTGTFVEDTNTVPDNENQERYSAPQPSGRFLYTANRNTGNVAVIDSSSLAVEIVAVGAEPIYVHALKAQQDQGAAVVVHRDAAVAILRTGVLGATQVVAHAGVPGLNKVASSPDGRFVIAYHDINSPEGAVAGSDQEVVVIDTLSVAPAITLTVGLHPREIVYTPDSATAYVLTADGVSRIDLSTLSQNFSTTLLSVVAPNVDPSLAETKILAN